MTLASKMEKLKFIGFLGVLCITVFIVSFLVFFTAGAIDHKLQTDINMFPEHWFSAAAAVPNILLALSYQMNFFPIFKGMKNANDKKMLKASLYGSLFCSIVYVGFGVMGFYYVGRNV